MEQNLVFVVDFSLCQAFVTLVTHVRQPLLKSDLLRVVELFKVSELLLRGHVDLVDSVLKLLLSLLELVLELLDLLLEAVLRQFNVFLVLGVLLLTEG